MTDPERDHLLGRIAALEQRLRRWRLACIVLFGLLLLPVVLGGLLGFWWVPRLERERVERLKMERDWDLLQQLRVREQSEQDYNHRVLDVRQDARREAERQRAQAEEGAQRGRSRDRARTSPDLGQASSSGLTGQTPRP
jgi:hypothetical protein